MCFYDSGMLLNFLRKSIIFNKFLLSQIFSGAYVLILRLFYTVTVRLV